MFAEDKEELCRHGGDLGVGVGQQGHQTAPHTAPFLRLALKSTTELERDKKSERGLRENTNSYQIGSVPNYKKAIWQKYV